MDNSDDLYDDSFELDDETLSLLDQVEAQYAEKNELVTRQPETHPPFPPPPTNWKQKEASQDPENSEISLPDVIAINAGGYSLPGVHLVDEVSRLADLNAINRRADNSFYSSDASWSQLGDDVNTLRSEIIRLFREREAAEKALKEAQQARYMKEGEVSILRKQLEKAAQDHAVDLDRVRTSKETADEKHIQVQKKLKEDLERMRTELTFKQHELESSARRVSTTARSTRTSAPTIQSPNPSPIPVPPEMRDWNPSGSDDILRSKKTPTKQLGQRGGQGKASINNIPRFPGFENSFAPMSPTKSPSKQRPPSQKTPRKNPPKSNTSTFSPVKNATIKPMQLNAQRSQEAAFNDTIQEFDMDVDIVDNQQGNLPQSSPVPDFAGSMFDDESFSESDSEQQVDSRNFSGVDWRNEFLSLVLMHKHHSSQMFTTQFLLSASFGSKTTKETIDAYQQACSRFLEALGSSYIKFEKMLPAVAESMIAIIDSLIDTDLTNEYLTAIIDLTRTICISFPAFSLSLLRHNDGKLLSLLLDQIQSDSREARSSCCSFRVATLSLFDVLCLTISSEESKRLAPIVLCQGLFLRLLGRKQKPGIIKIVVRLLCSLASHPSLHKHILSQSGLVFESESQEESTLLEYLSVYLVDPNHLHEDDARIVLSTIIEFCSILALPEGEATLALIDSNTIVPAIGYYLFRLAAPIWDDCEDVTNDQESNKRTVKMIVGTTQLLHYLVFDAGRSSSSVRCDLRHKLYYAPHRLFSGLAHMFIVTIGRLSYADPPDWLPLDLQRELVRITDLARDLLDLVVENPENDAIWMAYQNADSTSNATEGEMKGVEAI